MPAGYPRDPAVREVQARSPDVEDTARPTPTRVSPRSAVAVSAVRGVESALSARRVDVRLTPRVADRWVAQYLYVWARVEARCPATRDVQPMPEVSPMGVRVEVSVTQRTVGVGVGAGSSSPDQKNR